MYDGIANVGVTDGRIAVITKARITGKETIDATGLVVAPGFIDTHFHAVDPFASKMAVADGITTGMDLEAGASPVGEWYAQRDKTGWQINYGTTSSLAVASRRTCRVPRRSSHRPHPTTCRAPSCRWTAAGWRADWKGKGAGLLARPPAPRFRVQKSLVKRTPNSLASLLSMIST